MFNFIKRALLAGILIIAGTGMNTVPVNAENPDLSYQVHLSSIGWVEKTPAGTESQSGRIEAIIINLGDANSEIEYQTHVQSIGWMNPVKGGEISGTTGKSLRAEAIRIWLKGSMESQYDIYYRTKAIGYGWLGWSKNGESSGTEGYSTGLESIEIRLEKKNSGSITAGNGFYKRCGVEIQAHVQRLGWMSAVTNGKTAGTTGQSLRMEGLIINLSDELAALGDIKAYAHVQSYGWLPAVGNGELIGTTGKSKRLEAVRIELTDKLAEQYDIYYRVHTARIGWLDYAKNGELAGTTGYGLGIEAIEVIIEPKNGLLNINTDGIKSYEHLPLSYEAHVSKTGWMQAVEGGDTAGLPGQSRNLEALIITLPDEALAKGNISIEAHVRSKGWLSAVGSGEIAGTTGESLRMEGIKISLTGELANQYDIYYRTYVQGLGWLGWTKNGGLAGSEGCSRAIEAVQVNIIDKNLSLYTLSTAYTTLKYYDFYDTNSLLLLANKKHKLPSGYEPGDLVVPNVPMNYTGTKLRREAASALERMFAAAKKDGITLILGSGYRSEAYQRTLYNGYAAQYGTAEADRISARPGYSDHQTGLAADISDHDGRTYLTQSMENTAEGIWLRNHAHEYGFIMRYPKGKESITGYAYEPWHFRYIGVDYATAIFNKGVWYTFEEYFGVEGGDYYR